MGLHGENAEWREWARAMEGWRAIAHRLFQSGKADYVRQCKEAEDRLTLIQVMERRVCTCTAIAEYLNEALTTGVSLVDLNETPIGRQIAAIEALAESWYSVLKSLSLVEVNQDTCKADGRDWLLEMEAGYNAELKKVKEEVGKEHEDPDSVA
jgi:hypothetical protein